MYVITLKGWEESQGVQAEIKFAKEHKISVKYVEKKWIEEKYKLI